MPSCTRKVVLLADRGFAEVALMRLCQPLGWRYRLRLNSNFLVHRSGHRRVLVDPLLPKRKGQAVLLQAVSLTGEC